LSLLDLCLRRLRSSSQDGSWTLLQLHAEHAKVTQVSAAAIHRPHSLSPAVHASASSVGLLASLS
jgi:hypothetical protein